MISRSRAADALRTYAAATLLNLALVSAILTPPDRLRAAQVRIVTDARRFRDTELIQFGDDTTGILSVPYIPRAAATNVDLN